MRNKILVSHYWILLNLRPGSTAVSGADEVITGPRPEFQLVQTVGTSQYFMGLLFVKN